MISVRHQKRAVFVRALFMIGFLILWLRFAIIQIYYHDFYAQLAQQQYRVILNETPARATIYDRHNVPLAFNKIRYAVFLQPHKLTEPEKVTSFLKKNFPQAYERLLKAPASCFMYIKRRLTPLELDMLEQAQLHDIGIIEESQRYYPYSYVLPVIGVTDIDNKGIAGLELQYDKQLRGTPARYSIEREARQSKNYYFKKNLDTVGTEGRPIVTTLDSVLQFFAFEEVKEMVTELGSSEGAALIMDPDNGDILACVNYPVCDSEHDYGDFEKLKNRVVTDVHEFGSVMKIFPALAALEEKVVAPQEKIDCESEKIVYLNGIRISTWKAHGVLPYCDVVSLSNNIGTSKVTQRLGPCLYAHLQKCGFGKKTQCAFPGEVAGYINPPQKWTTQSLFSLSFGYEMNATLLQLGQAFCMIARNGTLIRPRFTLSEPIVASEEPLYSPETMATINYILERTISDGTAHRARIDGVRMRGKTGTANILSNGIYDNNRNIFTFGLIIEKGSYKRVIITFIKESKYKNIYSSSVAVPLAERIAQKMLLHEKPF